MNRSNIRFGIVALLVLFVVGWSRADDAIRVSEDQSFVTLRGGQYVSNFGEVWNRTKPLRIHGMPDAAGKKPKVGLVWHRPQHSRPGDGTQVNTSLHGCLLQSVTFTGQFDVAAFYNSGVEEGTYINVVVDAQCGVAKTIFTTSDVWGLGFPHGPTLSGGNIVSMRLYGSGGVGFLAVGEVTDLYAGQISTSGTGLARFQFHSVPPYQWPQWGGGTATSEGRPKRIVFTDTRMSEGAYTDAVVFSVPSVGVSFASEVQFVNGTLNNPVRKIQTLGVGNSGGPGPGGADDPPRPPSGLPAGIPAPEWGMDVRTDAPPNRTFSGGAFPYVAAAGDVIEIAAGNYPAGMGNGYMQLEARGTRERPVILRGVGMPRLGQKLYLRNSSYVYITGLDATKIDIGENCDHWIIADCRIGEGPKLEWINNAPVFAQRKGGGLAIAAPDSKPTTHGLVIRCQIVDNGDFALGEANEIHGITINGAVSYVTVLDCELARNSGDGMQVNGGAMDYSGPDPRCKLNNIRVGRVDTHDNRQVGVALKQCADVILSGVKSHGHRPYGPSPSAWGAGFGLQYGPARVWLVNCESYDNVSGVSGGSSNGPGGSWNFINFYAHDNSRAWTGAEGDDAQKARTGWVAAGPGKVTHPRLQAPNDSWGPAGMAIAGSPDVTVISATLRNNDAGLNFPGGQRVQVLGSIIDGLQQPEGNAAFIYDTQYLRDFAFVGNAIASGSDRFQRGGQRSGMETWLAAFGSAARTSVNVIATGGTWTPTAADRATFDEFKRRYGLDIDVDFSGAARPVTRKIGATER